MHWETAMLALLDDLEQQAEGLALAERDATVAELMPGEYAEVALAGRLHACDGAALSLRLLGGRVVSGTVRRTGADWVLLAGPAAQEWLVPLRAVQVVSGAPSRAVSEPARSVLRRLPLRAALRTLSDSGRPCLLHLADGHQVEGRLGRAGADFVELAVGEPPRVDLVATDRIVALQGR